MPYFTLPTFPGDTAYRYSIPLDGVLYFLDLTYMERHDAWYLSIYDEDEQPIRTGIRIITGWPLNLRDRDPAMPSRVFLAIRLDDLGDAPPSIDAWDGRVELLAITPDELAPDQAAASALTVEAVP